MPFMTDVIATRNKTRRPTPPGKVLAEDVLPATGKSKTEIAKLLGVSRQTLYDILDCKQPITPQMAVRIGKLCGNGPRLWLNMQAAHDLWKAQQTVDVSKIPTLQTA
jgi:antitoxin HigA-1